MKRILPGVNLFYGWKIVGALFIVVLNTGGTGLYAFPVFIGPLQQHFGWSITQISVAITLALLTGGIAAPTIGIMVGRYGVRKVMLVGAISASINTLGLASLLNIWMLYILMMISGFTVAATTALPAQTMITNWFDKFRGRAMSLTMLGMGAGGFIMPPLFEFLIRQWTWRTAWVFAFCALWILVIPMILAFLRDSPSDLGLLPDGAAAGKTTGAPISGLTVRQAVTSATFWLMVSAWSISTIGAFGMLFHFVPFLEQEIGLSSQQAAFYYGLIVGFSMIGRLVSGWLVDRMRPNLLMALTFFLMTLGPMIIELFLIRKGGHAPHLLLVNAVALGIGMGGSAIGMPILVSRCFGELNFAKIRGFLGSALALGPVVGVAGGGIIFDRLGTYEPVYIYCIFGFFLSALLMFFIQPERHHRDFRAQEG